jgi:hypothetical protein
MIHLQNAGPIVQTGRHPRAEYVAQFLKRRSTLGSGDQVPEKNRKPRWSIGCSDQVLSLARASLYLDDGLRSHSARSPVAIEGLLDVLTCGKVDHHDVKSEKDVRILVSSLIFGY